jgi:hypothetical protein
MRTAAALTDAPVFPNGLDVPHGPDVLWTTFSVRLPDGTAASVHGPARAFGTVIASGPADPARAALALRRRARQHDEVGEQGAAHECRERAVRILTDPAARGSWRVDEWSSESPVPGQILDADLAQARERALLQGRAAVRIPVVEASGAPARRGPSTCA